MTARDLFKRTPLRLAAGFAALSIITFVMLFSVLYFGIQARLEGQIRVQVEDMVEALRSVDDQRDFDDLARVVESESASVLDSDAIYEVVDTNGVHVAGHRSGVPVGVGWLNLTRSQLGLASEKGLPDDRFFALWRPVSKGSVLVGISNREARQTLAFLRRVFALALAGIIAATALVGTLLARRAQHRIAAFATTLSAVSRGEISTRVPMTGSDDDIDRVGAQINRTLSRLQLLIETVNQSSSDIAHDLKKPIGRLRQRLDTVRRSATSPDEFREALDDALTDIDSTMETFEALLRISQIEAGRSKERFARQDLSLVIDDVFDVYGPVAEDAGHSLVTGPESWGPCFVRGDRELLVQLFANLVENAILHCPPGTEISLRLVETPAGFVASVGDRGPGIPEAERAKVFRRLYRLERARSTPGTGLGLSLVKAIAELHDARIELVDNRPGLRADIHFLTS